MQCEYIKTYIDEIDKVLDGGIVKKSSVLFLGSKNSKKELLMMRLVNNRLKNGDALLYITTNKMPSFVNMLFSLNNYDMEDYEEKGMFRWVDAYSKSIGENVFDSDKVINVSNPQSLNELNISINKMDEELWNITPELINVYDNVSISFIQRNQVLTKRFFHYLIGNIKKNNATLFILMDKDAHDKETIASMSLFCDYVFDFVTPDVGKDDIKIKISDIFSGNEREISVK